MFSYLEYRINNKEWLICFVQKDLLLLVTSLFLFAMANLTIHNIIPNLIAIFLSLSIIALFLALSLSFLNLFFKKIDNKIEKLSIFIVIVLILTFIIVYTKICFLRFNAGMSNLYDLGNMEQAVWNTLHGNFLRTTTSNLNTRLGGHFDIFLVFLTPFYALWPSPKLLILIQNIIIGLGALPLFLIAKKTLRSSLAGLVFAFTYLISPILGAACLFDFHAITLVSSFLFFAFYFLLKKHYIFYFIFIVLALTCKEEVSLLIFLLGAYIYWKYNKKIGIVTLLLGLSWFVLAFFIIIPHFAQGAGNIFLTERYDYLGSNKSQIIKSIITNPGLLLKNLWDIKKLTYFLYLILPLGALMLFSPFTLLGIPSFAIYILSNYKGMFSGGVHYSAPLLFYLVLGSIFGIKFWIKKVKKAEPIILYSLLLLVLFSSLFFGCKFKLKIWGPERESFHVAEASAVAEEKQPEIKKIKQLIPENVSLSSSPTVGVHFAARENIYLFPRIDDASYVILDQPGLTWTQISLDDYKKSFEQLRKNNEFQIIYEDNAYLIVKRKKEKNAYIN
jgi:uncharacterized membrane protein